MKVLLGFLDSHGKVWKKWMFHNVPSVAISKQKKVKKLSEMELWSILDPSGPWEKSSDEGSTLSWERNPKIKRIFGLKTGDKGHQRSSKIIKDHQRSSKIKIISKYIMDISRWKPLFCPGAETPLLVKSSQAFLGRPRSRSVSSWEWKNAESGHDSVTVRRCFWQRHNKPQDVLGHRTFAKLLPNSYHFEGYLIILISSYIPNLFDDMFEAMSPNVSELLGNSGLAISR